MNCSEKNNFTSSDPHPEKSLCHNFWRIIWKYMLYKMVYTFWHSIPAFYLAFYLTFFSGILFGIYSDILFWPSIWYSFKLAVEVWQCPLRSGAHGSGPAVPTEIWSSQLRSDRRKEERRKEEEEVVILIKPRDPHLAGTRAHVFLCFGGPNVLTISWQSTQHLYLNRTMNEDRNSRLFLEYHPT